MPKIVNRKKALTDAIKSGAMIRVTDQYGDAHVGVIVGGNAYQIIVNLNGDEGRQSLIDRDGIRNLELV
jgi:hypothetical protein